MKKLIIYAKDNCPWCIKVEDYCIINQIPYKKMMLGTDYQRDELLRIVDSFGGTTYPLTVPKIVSVDNTIYYDSSEEFEKKIEKDMKNESD